MKTIANREVAWSALFAMFSGLPQFKTCTRHLKHWQDVPPEDQPALFLQVTGEMAQPVRGQPTRIVLEGNVWLYVRTDGDPVGPILNPLLDLVDSALAPKNDGDHAFTLGGIVHHCWIEGNTQVFEGDLGNEAVAVIPVKMLVT